MNRRVEGRETRGKGSGATSAPYGALDAARPSPLARKARMASAESREGMHYLDTLPRRWVTVYIPLLVFLFVLLFPFYWMVVTSFKPNAELLSTSGNPFWVAAPTFDHFHKLFFETSYPRWMWNTIIVSVTATFVSLAASVFAAYAIE